MFLAPESFIQWLLRTVPNNKKRRHMEFIVNGIWENVRSLLKTLTLNKSLQVLQLFCCFEIGSLHSCGCPGTHYVDMFGLELTEILLLLPPESGDY